MAAWSRKTCKFVEESAFFRKTTTYGKFSKFCCESFHRLTFYSNLVKLVRRDIVHYLPDKNKTKFRLPLKLSLLVGSCPKSAMASPQQTMYSECFRFHPNLLNFGGGIAELRVNTTKLPRKANIRRKPASFQPNNNRRILHFFGREMSSGKCHLPLDIWLPKSFQCSPRPEALTPRLPSASTR